MSINLLSVSKWEKHWFFLNWICKNSKRLRKVSKTIKIIIYHVYLLNNIECSLLLAPSIFLPFYCKFVCAEFSEWMKFYVSSLSIGICKEISGFFESLLDTASNSLYFVTERTLIGIFFFVRVCPKSYLHDGL